MGTVFAFYIPPLSKWEVGSGKWEIGRGKSEGGRFTRPRYEDGGKWEIGKGKSEIGRGKVYPAEVRGRAEGGNRKVYPAEVRGRAEEGSGRRESRRRGPKPLWRAKACTDVGGRDGKAYPDASAANGRAEGLVNP